MNLRATARTSLLRQSYGPDFGKKDEELRTRAMTAITSKTFFETTVALSSVRVRKVAVSELFLRLAVGCQQEGTSLWIHLRDATDLVGDPSDWQVKTNLLEKLWFLSDGEKTIKLSNSFGRVFLGDSHAGVRQLAVKFLLFFNYFVSVEVDDESTSGRQTIRIVVQKSDAFKRGQHADVHISLTPIDDNRVTITTRSFGPNSFEFDSRLITQMLQEVSETIDLVSRRELMAESRRQDAARKAAAELEAARQIQQFAKDERKTQRLREDRCLDCGEYVIQRRNNRDGHLFFGCSQFAARRCNGAREITCPDCGASMVEKNTKNGGTFLGCSRWPQCRGSRSVNVSTGEWNRGRNSESSESLDDMARDWGWSSWRQFDEHRE